MAKLGVTLFESIKWFLFTKCDVRIMTPQNRRHAPWKCLGILIYGAFTLWGVFKVRTLNIGFSVKIGYYRNGSITQNAQTFPGGMKLILTSYYAYNNFKK